MKSYFKPRRPFSISPHPYDLGTFTGLWYRYDDNHFLLKIYKLEESSFADYYNHHMTHALENDIASEENFFRYVWHITHNRIRHFEQQNPFSASHAKHKKSIAKLQQFQKYLNSIDLWNARPPQIVIAEKETTIAAQSSEIEKLQKQLATLNEYEVAQKIRIEENFMPTVIDLIKQLAELQLPSGRKLLRCDHKSPYYKMLSKYFSDGGKDIPIETLRNYFVDKKGDVASKGTTIAPEHQLFRTITTK